MVAPIKWPRVGHFRASSLVYFENTEPLFRTRRWSSKFVVQSPIVLNCLLSVVFALIFVDQVAIENFFDEILAELIRVEVLL